MHLLTGSFRRTSCYYSQHCFRFPLCLPLAATMFRTQLLRQATRAVSASSRPIASRAAPALSSSRSIHSTAVFRRDESKEEHEGTFARTDESIQVEYPEEGDLPSSAPVQGRGGMHFRRTLASFSLEGRVGVVTGGARGLGLVMSQAMVISGADVAIVDLNSKSYCLQRRIPADSQQRRRQKSRPKSL